MTNSSFSASRASSTSRSSGAVMATSVQHGVAGLVGAAIAAMFV